MDLRFGANGDAFCVISFSGFMQKRGLPFAGKPLFYFANLSNVLKPIDHECNPSQDRGTKIRTPARRLPEAAERMRHQHR
jgi:hypothetical protein